MSLVRGCVCVAYCVVSSSEESQESCEDGSHARGEEESPFSSLQPGDDAGCCIHCRVAPSTVQVTILRAGTK